MGKKKKQEKQEKLKKQKDKLKKQEKAERKPAKSEKKKSGKKSEKAIDYLKVGKTGKAGGAVKQPEPVETKRAGRRKNGQAGASPDSMRIAAERFRALGDENRLQILALLEERELCAGDLLKSLSIVQSTLSHHMKILVESGLVTCRKQGKWSYYSISRETREELDSLTEQWTRGGK